MSTQSRSLCDHASVLLLVADLGLGYRVGLVRMMTWVDMDVVGHHTYV